MGQAGGRGEGCRDKALGLLRGDESVNREYNHTTPVAAGTPVVPLLPQQGVSACCQWLLGATMPGGPHGCSAKAVYSVWRNFTRW